MVRNEVRNVEAHYEESVEKRRMEKVAKEDAARILAEKAREAEERKIEESAKAEAKARREDCLRTFALKEAPQLWSALHSLEAEIVIQHRRIEELRKTLVEFNKDPEADADFKDICAVRNEMSKVRVSLRGKLEDAYLAFKKFEATPSRKDYNELRRTILEDGIQEAMSAVRRFDIMRKEK